MLINFFCQEIFQILIYFLCENCNPPEKSHPLLSEQPPLKVEVFSSPALFENSLEGSTPSAERGVPTMDWTVASINRLENSWLLYNNIIDDCTLRHHKRKSNNNM